MSKRYRKTFIELISVITQLLFIFIGLLLIFVSVNVNGWFYGAGICILVCCGIYQYVSEREKR